MKSPFIFTVESSTWRPEVIEYMKQELPEHMQHLVKYMSSGWGNGYVALFKGHPWYGRDFFDLGRYVDTDSELTFSQFIKLKHPHHLRSSLKKAWVIGFDTSHAGNTKENWPHERVVENTFHILDQAKEACKFGK